MKKVSLVFVWFLLGIAIGLPLGIYLVRHKFTNNEQALGLLNEEGVIDDFAKKEFFYADPQSARDALGYAIKIHEQMQNKSPLWGWPEKRDLGWCYADLSAIEEIQGNTSAAENYMAQAQRTLRETGVKDASEAHIREALAKALASNHPSRGDVK